MRIVFLILATLALLPSTAFAQDSATPVRVGDRAFTVAELKAAEPDGPYPPAMGAAWLRRGAADVLIEREWDTREAARRNIAVADVDIDAVMSEAQRRVAAFDWPEDAVPTREQVASGIRRELLVDAITNEAGPGPRAFGRAFDAFAARRRAVTRCLTRYADPRRDLCGNQRRHRDACAIVGKVDICSSMYGRSRDWELAVDLVEEFYDPPVVVSEPGQRRPYNRLYAYLDSHSPGASRRCFSEEGDWRVSFICPSRADAIAIAYAVTRIHQHAKRSWTVPANGDVI